ncbi:hypothetical protein GH714_039536 [Hevea brasiliensis]|uniref:Transmembrane 9 superfamily member n=1 Tax=Hevea brasiliensis TaxID=3981 RepID=A0A6A6KFS5_HEVBR|nr:hypothetical protein GH714_039536 [Hevea brasiliensis]
MEPRGRRSLPPLMTTICAILALLIHGARCFYLPGVAPEDFVKGDELKVKVNKLTSTKTQLPYSYYSLPYCRPSKILDSAENLGEVLRGDRIENSPYVFKMLERKMCHTVCRLKLDAKIVKEFKEKIDDEYRVNMILDNLPLVVPRQRLDQESPTVYQLGFHVGLKGQYSGSKEERYFIHNHLAFKVKFHRDLQTDSARIVGFEVKPLSVKHKYEGKWNDEKTRLTTCDPHGNVNSNTPQEVEEKKEVIFTYDVEFQESDVKWASRWDTYLLMSDDQIHWFSIVNSLMIVLFLSGMVAMIMLRTLYRDISKYNELETQEEAQEETGWKLVHGDVFRPPSNSDLLCVYVGTGVQFFGMTLVTMIFAILGFLSPSNRGGLMTAMLLLWVFMGLFAGYASARLYKMFKGTEWKKTAFRTAFMFPGIVSAIFFVLNALIWGQKSSGAVPFGTMFALVFLWFGISVPLVFVGSYIGLRKPAIEDPVKTNKIPRQIPEQAWITKAIGFTERYCYFLHFFTERNHHAVRSHMIGMQEESTPRFNMGKNGSPYRSNYSGFVTSTPACPSHTWTRMEALRIPEQSFSEAKEILIGGKTDSWKIPSSQSDSLNKWAESARFSIATLLEAYLSCNTSNPIEEYKDGNTKVKLDRSGPFYFISGAEGHCVKGQKMIVVVLSPRRRYTGISPAPSPAEFEGPAVAPTSTATSLKGSLVMSLGILLWGLF